MAADFRSLLKRSEDPRMFLPITIGGYELSVQASDFHYCSPRTNESSPEFYEEFEVAVFKDNKWVRFQVGDDGLLHGPWMHHIERTENTCILPYCPVDTVQALYDKLVSL